MSNLEKLQELQKKLDNLDFQMAQNNSELSKLKAEKAAPLKTKQKEAEQYKKEIQEEFEAKIAQLREEMGKSLFELNDVIQKANEELASLRTQYREIEVVGETLSKERSKLLQEINELNSEVEASERFKKLEEELKEYFETTKWGPALRDFQKEDILATINAYQEGKNGILNANVMGSGKTVEAIASLRIMTDDFIKKHNRTPRRIWITKVSLIGSTIKEILKWEPDTAIIPVRGDKSQREFLLDLAIKNNNLVICNYETLRTTPQILQIDWDVVIIDEVHKLKGGALSNPSRVFLDTHDLLWDKSEDTTHEQRMPVKWKPRFKWFMPLSGSPAQNHPREMWCYNHLFAPQRFPTVNKFEREFLSEEWDADQKRYVQTVDQEALITSLAGQVIRQPKDRIWASRPDKERVTVTLEHNEEQGEIYRQLKEKLFIELEGMDSKHFLGVNDILPMLTYLRQINVYPANITVKSEDGSIFRIDSEDSSKLDQAVDMIKEITEDNEQVVVWSTQFTGPLDALKNRIQSELSNDKIIKTAIMDGRNSKDHQKIESLFQDGEIDVLLCNRMSVAEGFNFQKNPEHWKGGARYAIFLDLWWNPEGNYQAEDRIWREGAKKGVIIYRLIIENSVDNLMLTILDEKSEMLGFIDSEKFSPQEWIGKLKELI